VTVPKDEGILLDALSQQPISVAIQADAKSFLMYKGGIFDDSRCGSALDHAVYLVGYGTDPDGTPYWKVKNSWGEGWGENGYIRMLRGVNMCGIAQMATYPIGVTACDNCTAGDTSDEGSGGGGGSTSIIVVIVLSVVGLALGLGLGLGL